MQFQKRIARAKTSSTTPLAARKVSTRVGSQDGFSHRHRTALANAQGAMRGEDDCKSSNVPVLTA